MRMNPRKRTLTVKIVYYGPGLSGKTTNLQVLHGRFPADNKGALVQLDTESERTLFFDYFPLALGNLAGFKVKVDFFTVPGQSFYHATRRAVLDGVDGIVFVADSSPSREEANGVSHGDMVRNLDGSGRKLEDVPHIYQWNKRDVRGAIPVKVLERTLNPEQALSVEAVAKDAVGVFETQSLLIRAVFNHVRAQQGWVRKHA